MNSEVKQIKAAELIELTHSHLRSISSEIPKEFIEIKSQAIEMQINIWKEMYEKYYSIEQLDALLGFYKSEMGKSILKTKNEILVEFQNKIHDLMMEINEQQAGYGTLKQVRDTGENDKNA